MNLGSTKYTYREVGRDEWDLYWSRVIHANLMQSWEYGEAKKEAEGWEPVRFLFEDEKKEPLALVQILTKTWPIIGGVARLNRGPLFLSLNTLKQGSINKLELLRYLKKIARRKRWWLFYVAPEIDANENVKELLGKVGLKVRRNNIASWGSTRLSLEPDEDSLMVGLKGKWRNLLRKSHKNGLLINTARSELNDVDSLLKFYGEAQKEKGFSGISLNLLRSLSDQEGKDWKFFHYISEGESSSDLAGMLVSIVHGDTATYLIGNTTTFGRKMNANYAMLWHAILDAKRNGCKWFDLGGINKNTPSGIRHFKEGVKGDNYLLIGEYILR